MSKLRADQIVDRAGTASPLFPEGLRVTGVATATSFSGNATGLTGNPDVTVGKLTINNDATVGGALTITGNLKVDGTQTIINTQSLEVEDKTVGVGSTASPTDTTADGAGLVIYGATEKSLKWNQTGSRFALTGGTLDVLTGGFKVTAGVSTFIDGFDANDMLKEEVNITAAAVNTAPNMDLANGMIHYFSTNSAATWTPNFRYNGSTTLGSKVTTGQAITVVVVSAQNSTSHFAAQMTIDGVAQTEEWNGGSAPSAGTGSGLDVYTYTLIRTGSGNTDWLVLANFANFA